MWWWRPLWDYCCLVAPELTGKVQYGYSNDGDGLCGTDAVALSEKLEAAIADGRCKQFEIECTATLEAIPDEACIYCKGTGTRTDIQVANGCSACKGSGRVRPFRTSCPFSAENVQEFAAFLRDSGGFEIC